MPKKPRVSTDGTPGLTSNPFAHLGRGLDLPEGATNSVLAPVEEPEVAKPRSNALLRRKLVVRRESKGRGGKTVTVIEGLTGPAADIEALARELRTALACGGTVEGETITLSGAHSDRVRVWLEAHGANHVIVGS